MFDRLAPFQDCTLVALAGTLRPFFVLLVGAAITLTAALGSEKLMRSNSVTAIDTLAIASGPSKGETVVRKGLGYPDLDGLPEPITINHSLNALGRLSDKQALMIDTLSGDLAVRVCGKTVRKFDQTTQPQLFKPYAPLYVALPEANCSSPQLSLSLSPRSGQFALGRVRVGKQDEVQAAYRFRRFLAVDLTIASTGIAIITALLTIISAGITKSPKLYFVFGLLMAFWAFRNVHYTGPTVMLGDYLRRLYFFMTTFGLAWLSAVFVNYWTFRSKRVQHFILYPSAAFLTLAFSLIAIEHHVATELGPVIGYTVCGLGLSVMIAQLCFASIKRDMPPVAETLMFLTALLVSSLDIVAQLSRDLDLPGREFWDLFSIPYAPMAAIIAVFALAISQFRQIRSVQAKLASSNETLVKEVAAKERELEAVYAVREAQAREATVLRERQRLMEDIHDGFGGRLLALSLQAENDDLRPEVMRDNLKDGLQDLRLIVDSMDTADGDLSLAFGSLRGRITPALEAANIDLIWSMDIDDHAGELGSRETLSLYRIIQEIVANCIRHANAQSIEIRIKGDHSGTLMLEFKDDGKGSDPNDAPGLGLRNIRNRVRDLGGEIDISGIEGFRIAISVPLQAKVI